MLDQPNRRDEVFAHLWGATNEAAWIERELAVNPDLVAEEAAQIADRLKATRRTIDALLSAVEPATAYVFPGGRA